MTGQRSRGVSLRLPAAEGTALAQSAGEWGISVSGGLDWPLCNTLSNRQLARSLTDCTEALDAELHVRIPLSTFEELKLVAEQLRIPVSVFPQVLVSLLHRQESGIHAVRKPLHTSRKA